MVLYLFDLDLEEGCPRMQESKKDLFQELLHHIENIHMSVVMILIVIGEHMKIKGPLREEDTKVRMGGHWTEETIRIEDILKEVIQVEMEEEEPLEKEEPLEEEDPLIEMEDPLMMEDPPEMDDILDTLEDEDLKDLLDL